MQKNFINVTPDSGGDNGTINVTASKNASSSIRSTSLTISGAGVTKIIDIFQSGVLFPIIDLGFIIDGTISGMNFEKRYTEYSKTLEAVFNYPKNALLSSNFTYFGVFNLGAFRPEVVITTGWFIDTIEITVVGYSPKTFTYTSDGSTFVNDDFTGGQLVYQNPYNYNLVKTMMNDIRSLGGEIIVTMKSSTVDPTICICDCIINP
jgi:hypothetical protein